MSRLPIGLVAQRVQCCRDLYLDSACRNAAYVYLRRSCEEDWLAKDLGHDCFDKFLELLWLRAEANKKVRVECLLSPRAKIVNRQTRKFAVRNDKQAVL